MTLVMEMIEKGHTYMQEVMRIGDDFVMADDDIKDIGHTSTEITDVAKKYGTDMLAVVGKGERHNLVTIYHESTHTKLVEDLAKIITLVQTIAEAYEIEATQVADAIKILINEGE